MRIPVILNNRNLLSYPSKMLEDLKLFNDISEIIMVDNGSSYEPLLDWYETKPCEIIRAKNLGHMSPWILDLPNKLGSKFYIVSDSDLDLSDTPKDSVSFLIDKLSFHNEYCKIGLSLSNWEVSFNSPYYSFLKKWAKDNWDKNKIVNGLILSQQIDTTFGIYDLKRNHVGRSCATDKPYSVKHIPWEFTNEEIDNMKSVNYEYYYYLSNSSDSSSYKKFINFNNRNIK